MKHVHDHLEVIEHDPLAGREAVHGRWPYLVIFAQTPFDLTGDRLQMRFRRARAYDEVIGESRNLAQIEDRDLFRFLVRSEFGAGFG